MNKHLILSAAAVSTTALAVPAMAQDAQATFTGPRVEVLAGYDISKAGSDVDDDMMDDDSQSIDGLGYGVGIGYDFAVGNAVLGVEGELSGSTAETQVENGMLEDIGFGAELDAGRDLYVGARAGVIVQPNLLLYAKGGYTNARYNLLASDGTTDADTDVDLDGWRIGAGAEYAMTERSFVKLEYRYSNYTEGEFDFTDDDFLDDDTGESARFDADLDRHQIMVGAGFRF